MNKVINMCDRCGKVVEFPNELKTLTVSYRHDVTSDWSLQLCASCKQEFDKVKEEFTKAKVELSEQDSKSIAEHILGKDENGGQ